MTKIFLVEDHPLFRMGIRQSLATYAEFTIVGEAGNARDAFPAIDAHPPDIVVMDVSLPGMDGVIATREIRRRAPRTRVLLLSVHDQISDVLEALDAGASGYALKTEGTEALVAALRTIIRNDRYVAPTLAALLGSYESRRKRPLDTLSILSLREREVFRLAADCLLTREIAQRALHLAEDGRHAPLPHSPQVGSAHLCGAGQAGLQSRPRAAQRRPERFLCR